MNVYGLQVLEISGSMHALARLLQGVGYDPSMHG